MPINDSINNIHMSNMFVTGGNANTNYAASNNATASAAGNLGVNANSLNAASSESGVNANFGQLLSGMMQSNTASMISSVGSFAGLDDSSEAYSSDSGMSGLMGMGSGMDALGSGSSGNNMIMMMLMLILSQQNKNEQNTSMQSNLTANNQNTLATQNCAHNAYTAASGQGIPTNSWVVANPSLTNNIGQRNANTYRAVMNQFNVETNQRYAVNKQGINDTYCNIFAWDVSRAMGAEIPHFVDASGAPVASGENGAKELNANQVNDWLNSSGSSYGWTKVSAEEAQYYANMGMPSVTSWKNSAGHGHLQMVSPSTDGSYDASRGVAIAQAGRQLKNYDYITSVYGASTLPHVEYFVHV